jgi:hypothetical protein
VRNFAKLTPVAIFIVVHCAYVNNLLLHAQCTPVICYTVCAVYANKANHKLILPFHLNQVKAYKKVKNRKKAILTHSNGPQRNLKQLFCANSKPKIVVSAHCAYANKDKMIPIWTKWKNKYIFFISALKSPTYKDFVTKKTLESKRSKISHLSTFKNNHMRLAKLFREIAIISCPPYIP